MIRWKKESEAILLRIFIGESDLYEGKPLYRHIIELCKHEKLAGAKVVRRIDGFGKTSHMHTTSILRLSTNLPIIVEIVDKKEKIEKVKRLLTKIGKEGLITEEKVNILMYEGKK